jgi:hypothetical protein
MEIYIDMDMDRDKDMDKNRDEDTDMAFFMIFEKKILMLDFKLL